MTTGRKVAIACQGGGSQCAFIAGALKGLFAQQIQNRFRIVGLSGTSGGALTAALAWYGLLTVAKGDERPIADRVTSCWQDLAARTPLEILIDAICVETVRLVERGVLPSLASSPSSPQFRFWAQATSMLIGRPEFTDLRVLLTKHLDFDALPTLIEPNSPVLLVGAGDILEGSFKVFSSHKGEIDVEALLASAAIPNLFPAVWARGHAYWDGIFSANPPIVAFLLESLMGKDKMPDEIWILQVNRWNYDTVPEAAAEIFDRRNQLAGNLSLRHELEKIELLNHLIRSGALDGEFRARFGFDASREVTIRYLRMSDDLIRSLDYPSKLSRQPSFIAKLIADGENQAQSFLSEMAGLEQRRD